MTIYICLLAFLFVAYIYDHSHTSKGDPEKRSNAALLAALAAVFLVSALRASSVGRDIPGYKEIYELTKEVKWSDYNYVYFEKGYVFLMKVCTSVGLDFQGFLAVCHFIILTPIYFFIRRYSRDKVLSVFVFVCYMFFEFTLTGLRQATAMSIALVGFMVLMSKFKGRWLWFISIIFLAAQFHKSAYICLLILPFLLIHDIGIFTLLIVATSAISLIARRQVLTLIKSFFEKEDMSVDKGLHIGLNLILLMILAALFLLARRSKPLTGEAREKKEKKRLSNDDPDDVLLMLFMLSIVFALVFGESSTARSFMYYNMTITVLLPNSMKKISGGNYLLVGLFMIAALIAFFFYNSLSGGSFDITPYRFFWQPAGV
ncbi:MAG: EpsG family protein [Clostridia bacterium]|nr:EpsG family protein [Clostridia bacterium]